MFACTGEHALSPVAPSRLPDRVVGDAPVIVVAGDSLLVPPIEGIEIIRGAAGSALYGSQACRAVIQITTRPASSSDSVASRP